MSPIAHPLWSLLVVALGDLANPGAGVASALGNGSARLPLGQEPEHLPPRPFMWLMWLMRLMWLVGRTVALFKGGDAQMRRQMNLSAHASMLRAPSRKPYDMACFLPEPVMDST